MRASRIGSVGWLPIALLPRRILPVLLCGVVTAALAVWVPSSDLYIGPADRAPRVLRALEYGTMLVGLALAIGLTPRFPDWDRYGAPRTRTAALLGLSFCVVLPIGIFLLLLTMPLSLYDTSDADALELLPLLNNITISSLAAYSLVGSVGRLLGSLIWAGGLCTLLYWQATMPSWVYAFPLNMHLSSDYSLDSEIRWFWIGLFLVASMAVAWKRRGVPVRLAIRTDD